MNQNKKKNDSGRQYIHGGSSESAALEKEIQRIISSLNFKMKQRELRLVDRYKKRNQETLVSVIMPTWNRRTVIKRAIDSVLAQSYQNYELIISDDGSTDGTADFILKEYGDAPRLFYICNEHRGVSHARNTALEKAKGQMIAYLDSDNQWASTFLMVMVNSLEDFSHKSSAYCGIRVINKVHHAHFTRLVDYDRTALEERNFIDMNIFVHKKSLFHKYGGFLHDIEPLEDWELILRYTRDNPPLIVKCCLANYYVDKTLNHQSLICDMDSSYQKIRTLYRH